MLNIRSEGELRRVFWQLHPRYQRQNKLVTEHDYYYGHVVGAEVVPCTQNDYHVDVRTAWCDFVDRMQRDGEISMEFAAVVTL